MARWVAEETIEEIEVQVTMLVPLKKVTVEDKASALAGRPQADASHI